MGGKNSLKPIAYRIPQTSYTTAIIQAPDALYSPHIPRYRPGCCGRVGRDLGPALYQFRRRADDKGGQAACCAGEEDFGEVCRRRGILVEQGEGAVVGYEEEGVESAVAKYRCCCACTEPFYSLASFSSLSCLFGLVRWVLESVFFLLLLTSH